MSDAFTSYEIGLKRLLKQLDKNHPRYTEVLTLQSRLLENIAQTRRYGDTETRRAERAQITDMLNQLALEAVGMSFNELCSSAQLQEVSNLPIKRRVASLCKMGEEALAVGNYAHAHHCFVEALKLDPYDQKALQGKIRSLIMWGDAAYKAGKFVEAHHYYSLALQSSPEDDLIRTKKNNARKRIGVSSQVDNAKFLQQRLQDLSDHLAQDLALLKEYEDALRYEDDPRRRAKYRREIEQLRDSVTHYQREYELLRGRVSGELPPDMQNVAIKLQQIDAKLDVLLTGQMAIHNDIIDLRQMLLSHYASDERAGIVAIVEHLDQTQLVTVLAVLEALEADRLPYADLRAILVAVQQSLAALRQQGITLPSEQLVTEAITAPKLDVKHKLKITLPIIPLLLGYEGELELGSGVSLEAIWEQLVKKVRRN